MCSSYIEMLFYSNDADVINKQNKINDRLIYKDTDLISKYELEKCVNWICSAKYDKVCLQFPDELLGDVASVVEYIESKIENKVYVLADTSYGSCCIHDITARHVDADAVIHFGRACLSRSYDIPVLYIFPKVCIDVDDFISQFSQLLKTTDGNIVLLYDVIFLYCINEIKRSIKSEKIVYSQLVCCEPEVCGIHCSLLNNTNTCHSVKKLGRTYCCSDESDNVYVYLTTTNCRRNLDNFIANYPGNVFYSYNNDSRELMKESLSRNIRRRLYQIEKVKDANIVGILIAVSPNDETLALIQRIKMLCRRKSKKCYTLYVGSPNVAKLANFPEIDVFVFLSCLEGELTEGDYYQPVVTMMELELALNEAQTWKNKIIADMREFLPGGCEYVEPASISTTDSVDVSLISNKLRSVGLKSDDEENISTIGTVSLREPLTVASVTNCVNDGLTGRSWKGLEFNVGDVPVTKAVIGCSGTPSSGYKNPNSDIIK